MGLFDRVVDRLKTVASDDDLALAPQGEDLAAAGVLPIGATGDRARATVQGRVTALTLPASSSVPALLVELHDSTGALELVFVGRRGLPGIECGVVLRATGRVSQKGSHRMIYNPTYEIVPPRER